MLFIVATPIGNLEDLSKRALRVLEESDAILCEDTRRSLILLKHFGIKKRLISYHKFKEKKALAGILADLEAGKDLALISDAGTPCISDPGQRLVAECLERGLKVSAIPGPCSAIQALVMSGFDTSRFQFVGFLPKKPVAVLRQAMAYPGTTVAFESPERLMATLGLINGDRRVAVVREMTKAFEECQKGKASKVLAYFTANPPRGEIVLVIEGGEAPDDLLLDELVTMLRELHGLPLKEAIKWAAKWKNMPKKILYKKFHRSANISAKDLMR